MLGIKDLIDGGNLRSKQYIDLLPQSYPPQEGPVDPSQDADSSSVEAQSPPDDRVSDPMPAVPAPPSDAVSAPHPEKMEVEVSEPTAESSSQVNSSSSDPNPGSVETILHLCRPMVRFVAGSKAKMDRWPCGGRQLFVSLTL